MAATTAGQKKNHSLVDFGGVNTQALRQQIGDNEFAWLEDVMPIGHGNMKVLPGPSSSLVTLPNNDVAYYMAGGNISGVEYMFMFCASGAAYQVNLSSYEITTIGAAGTFSASGTAFAQWKNERIVIVDPANGYFDWNGTTLTTYKGSIFSVTIGNGGINYTGAPSVVPASGSAAFTATIGVLVGQITGAGTGYAVNDVITVSGGVFNTACTLTVSAVSGTGAITGLNLTSTGDYTTYAASPAATTGGHGTGATVTLNFGITKVVVTTPSSGYAVPPTLNISGGGGSGASLTAVLSSSTNGTSIAVYSSRVWIANNRTIVFSAPSSYQDFTQAGLGGSLIMTDDTMRSNIYRLFSSNNYLYIFGNSSINVISGVAISTTAATSTSATFSVTTFSNANVSPSIGTAMPYSVASNYRTIMFANDYGVYGLNGVTPTKMSDALDGMYSNIDFTQPVSAGSCLLFNILCLCYLFKYNDPVTGTARQVLAIYFGKKWFFSAQVPTMNFIAQSMNGDVPVLYGTDGTGLYKLFSQTANVRAHKIQSKLWDMGSSLITKQAFKVGIENISPVTPATMNISIDSETASQNYPSASANTMIWLNNLGMPITWTNNAGLPIQWLASGYVMARQDVSQVGNYLGVTITSSSPGLTYAGIHLQYEPRTPWAGVPW